MIEAVGTSDQVRFRPSVHIEPSAGCRYYYCESHGDGYSAETKRRSPVIGRCIFPTIEKLCLNENATVFSLGDDEGRGGKEVSISHYSKLTHHRLRAMYGTQQRTFDK